MRLVFHPKVSSDIARIMEHYEEIGSGELAGEFYAELRQSMVETAARAKSFSVRLRDVRRVNLQRFPYHYLFREVEDGVRILVVRHHRRRPSVGATRR